MASFLSIFLSQSILLSADDNLIIFDENLNYVEGEVFLKFNESVVNLERFSGRQILGAFERIEGLESEDVFEEHNLVLVAGTVNESTEELIERLNDNNLIEYVEPNYVRKMAVIPSDTHFALQWGLNNTAQTVNGIVGISDADIDAPEAFDLFTSSSNVIVAVMDTGILATHEDLSQNLWDGSGGCNDENNNLISGGCPNHGFDFVNDDNNPDDDHGHGTFVSGIIGAIGNNSKGISGVSQSSKIMSLKVLDADGFGSTADLIRAVNFAKNNGAKIINASLTGGSFSQAEKDAIDSFNGLLIAAAGNGGDDQIGDDNDILPQYPASYASDNIISVAATDQSDVLTSFSNFGLSSVDLGAPGKNILSTFANSDSSYGFASGTSASAPFVSGAASLLWHTNTLFTASQIKNLLLSTGDLNASLTGKSLTARRLNVFNLLSDFNPVGGFISDNLVPSSQIVQSLDGLGIITIPFRVKDIVSGLDVTLNSFEYSMDGGVTFVAPINGDLSLALSSNWNDNNYVSSTDFSGDIFNFTINVKHPDIVGLSGLDQDDIVVRFKINDGFENSAYVVSENFRIDLSLPDVTGLVNDGDTTTSKVWLWDSSDSNAVFRFSVDQNQSGVPVGDYALVKSVTHSSGDGIFYLHVQSKDSFGNESEVITGSFIMDHTGPDISGLADDLVSAKTKIWNWTSSDSQAVFRYIVDKNVSGVPVGNYGADLTTSQLTGDGTFYLHIQAKDLLGNETPVVTVSAILDNSAPIITSINNDTNPTNSKVWTFSSTDLSSVTYRYLIDQDPNGIPSGDFVAVGGVIHSTGSGEFFIHLQSTDVLGNISNVVTGSFLMDTIPPASLVLEGLPVSTESSSVVVIVSGTDVTNYKFRLDGGSFSDEKLVSEFISLSGLGVGIHVIEVIGRDLAGNYQSLPLSGSWVVSAPASSSGGGGDGGGSGSGSSSGSTKSSKAKKNSEENDADDSISVVSAFRSTEPTTLSVITGSINSPQVVVENALPKVLAKNLKYINAVDIKENSELSLDKDLVLKMIIPEGVKYENPRIFYFDSVKENFVLAGDGGQLSSDGKSVTASINSLNLFVLVDYSQPFSDIVSHWSKPFVEHLYELGVVSGKGSGNFYDPDGNLTRAELTKIAILTFDRADFENSDVGFIDVDKNSWYYRFVKKAFVLGVVNGYNDGSFRPDAPVNRAEALKILLLSSGLDTGFASVSDNFFADVGVEDWYFKYVSFAFKEDIVNGKTLTTFAADDFVTRSEMAKMAVKTLNLVDRSQD